MEVLQKYLFRSLLTKESRPSSDGLFFFSLAAGIRAPTYAQAESAFANGEVSRLCIPPKAVSCHARRSKPPRSKAERSPQSQPRAANSVNLSPRTAYPYSADHQSVSFCFCLFLINIISNHTIFLEPNYTYKCKNICYNDIANRFDNFKILMYN